MAYGYIVPFVYRVPNTDPDDTMDGAYCVVGYWVFDRANDHGNVPLTHSERIFIL